MTNTGRAAFFVGSGAAPGAALEVLTNREGVPLSAIDVVCCEQPAGLPSPRSYPLGVSATSAAGQHDRDRLGRIAKALSPGAKLYIYEAAGAGFQGRTDTLAKELVLSGFQGFEAIPTQGASLLVLVSTPKWELGAKAALSLQPRAAVEAQQDKPAASKAAAWTVAADDADEEEELIDEAQLLTEADKVRLAPAADDCEVGKEGRKACKNCTCGRAEAEAAGVKAQLTPEMLENPQSACGSCGLGDAFRCAGCPYRGLPSFEPGKKIELPSDFLAADF